MKRHWILAWALCSNLALAQSVPDAGLRAETAGQWADAVAVYAQALQANPAQAHLWERIADIRASQLKDPTGAATALAEAVKYAPDDARLHAKLSQAHAVAQQPAPALAVINRAVALEPGNAAYLRARAEIAAWQGDHAAAQDSYQRLLALAPDDAPAQLGTARVHHWRGELCESERAYQAYLTQHPDDAAARMETIVVVTELGDYARALEMLEIQAQRFGDSPALRKQQARVLAWAQRPTRALAEVDALAPTHPDDYELAYTRTVALHHAHRPHEALASLAHVARLRPTSAETADLGRFIRTPLRSSATVGAAYSAGSDDVSLRRFGARGEYVINPDTRLFGGGDRQWLHADAGSGFEKPGGGTTLGYNRAWLGVQHRLSPMLSIDGQVGHGRTEGDGNFIYQVGADLQPADELALRVSRRQDLHTVSPRAAALGIERRANTLDANWTPDLRHTVAARLAYDTFSDGNDRWEAQLGPRRAFVRSQRFNLDLGISGVWFGYDRDPGNGYYAPSRYQRYALTAFTYWKLSDDDGISVAFGIGPYKDNTMGGYRTGGDISAEGFFGIYRDWYLNVKAAYSDYGGGYTGAYRSHLFELNLTRRF
ncbi:MAG: tetratricopeptide repeat protein [Thiobacillus sp.]|uniref:tetratricopeptide repeat protein n=1 Tax=Thiobacillus sp. TaxID=924 RepID=UPI00273615F1|nr:tetratricopeptide repeat protein [Thiobacillus sp.]MDP3584668.1 tetratricopeptide repeat protein [Thiobacillus sp.]